MIRDHRSEDGIYGHKDLQGYYFSLSTEGHGSMFKEVKEKNADWAVTEYDKGGDLYVLVMTRKDTKYDDPAELEGTQTAKAIRKYDTDLARAFKSRTSLQRDKLALIMILKGQCFPELKEKLMTVESPKSFADCVQDHDVLGVLDLIEGLMFGTVGDGEFYPRWNQVRMMRDLFNVRLTSDDPRPHCKNFKAQLSALENATSKNFPFGDNDDAAANEFKAALFLSSLNGHRGAFGISSVARRPSVHHSHQQVDLADYGSDDRLFFLRSTLLLLRGLP